MPSLKDKIDIGEHSEGSPYMGFTIIPGAGSVVHASLIYNRGKWKVSLYSGGHYNGPDLEIGERQAEQVLKNISPEPIEEMDYTEVDWAEFECGDCPHDE